MSPVPVLASLAVVGLVALLGGATVRRLRRRHLVVVITGDSMLPAYRSGDRLLVRRVPLDAVRSGQVVVIEQDPAEVGPDDPRAGPHLMLKRAVAVPGDPVPSACFPDLLVGSRLNGSVRRVPSDCLLVLGDNPAESYDSRHYGYVPAGRFVGLVTKRMTEPAPSPPQPSDLDGFNKRGRTCAS